MLEDADFALLRRIAARRPAVHCLTNTVVQALTANMLLAVEAIPSMSADPEEVASFTAGAGALLVNLGTLDPMRKNAIEIAIDEANRRQIPWVLDPVLVDRAPKRRDYAMRLLALKPALIRGNGAEIRALSDNPETLAVKTGAVVAETGATDIITDGALSRALGGGDPMMGRVTGIGCAGTALLAAALAASPGDRPHDVVVSGLRLFGKAGEEAAARSEGPASFAANLLDKLYQFSQTSLQERKEI